MSSLEKVVLHKGRKLDRSSEEDYVPSSIVVIDVVTSAKKSSCAPSHPAHPVRRMFQALIT